MIQDTIMLICEQNMARLFRSHGSKSQHGVHREITINFSITNGFNILLLRTINL